MAQRLCVLLRAHNMRLSLCTSIKLTLMGTFFNFCLPGSTGGDAIKIYYALEGNHGRRTELATLMLFDRAVGMFVLLILPVLVLPLFPGKFSSIEPISTLVAAAAAISAVMLVSILLCFVKRIRESRLLTVAFETVPLGHFLERVFNTIYAYRQKPGSLITATAISLLSQLLNIGVILVLARATTMNGPVPEMIVLIPFGFLATSVPVTPGGLGVGEAAFDRLFAIAGLTGGAQLLLGWRLLSIAIGFTGLGFYLQGRKLVVHTQVAPGLSEEKFSTL